MMEKPLPLVDKKSKPASKKWQLSKRKARVEALKKLFSHEFHFSDTLLSDTLHLSYTISKEDKSYLLYEEPSSTSNQKNKKGSEKELSALVFEYSKYLIEGVLENKQVIDSLIKRSSLAWDIKRIALVDLNIIRIAIFEMLYSKKYPLSFKVCIDEAIEIAKVYSSMDSSSYVNGILDSISKIKSPPVL